MHGLTHLAGHIGKGRSLPTEPVGNENEAFTITVKEHICTRNNRILQ